MNKRWAGLIVPLPNNKEESNIIDESEYTIARCSNIGIWIIDSLCIRSKIIPILLLYILLNHITTLSCSLLIVSLLEPSSSSWTLSPIVIIMLILVSNRVLTLTKIDRNNKRSNSNSIRNISFILASLSNTNKGINADSSSWASIAWNREEGSNNIFIEMEEKEASFSIDTSKIAKRSTNKVLSILRSDVEINLLCDLIAGQCCWSCNRNWSWVTEINRWLVYQGSANGDLK
jgi:hypothetical protein